MTFLAKIASTLALSLLTLTPTVHAQMSAQAQSDNQIHLRGIGSLAPGNLIRSLFSTSTTRANTQVTTTATSGTSSMSVTANASATASMGTSSSMNATSTGTGSVEMSTQLISLLNLLRDRLIELAVALEALLQ